MSEYVQLDEAKCRVAAFQKKLVGNPDDLDTQRNLNQALEDVKALQAKLFPETQIVAPAPIIEEVKISEEVVGEVPALPAKEGEESGSQHKPARGRKEDK